MALRRRYPYHRMHIQAQQLIQHRSHICPGAGIRSREENIIGTAHQEHQRALHTNITLRQQRAQPHQHTAGRVPADAFVHDLPARLLRAQPCPPLGRAHTIPEGQAVADADQFHFFSLSHFPEYATTCSLFPHCNTLYLKSQEIFVVLRRPCPVF